MLRRFVLLTTLACALVVTACSKEHRLDAQVEAAPQAVGKLVNGQTFNLIDNKDKVTVVQFWATWCPTCVKEMPVVQTWYDTNKSKGLQLISISIDDSRKDVSDWLAKNPNYTQPYAWQGEVQHNFGKIKGTPTFIVVDKGGVVVKTLSGGVTQADLDGISKLL